MESVQFNAVGVDVIATVKEDDAVLPIGSASTKQLVFRKPNGTSVTKDADFVTDGSDGQIVFTSDTDFFNVLGVWSVQAYVVLGSGFDGRSDVTRFEVRKNL